jgi:hypothetical protein
MVVEAANAGPLHDSAALITAVESVPASVDTFAGQNFNYIQFRTRDGGVEIGNVTIDAQVNITGYDPWGIMWTLSNYFNSGTFAASGTQEDASGNFFTVVEQDGSTSTVFGTQSGLWAGDNDNGAIIGLPKASSKAFNSVSAGTYSAIYYEKPNADAKQRGSRYAGGGKSQHNGGRRGSRDHYRQPNNVMASGTLAAVADTPYVYDGTPNTLPDPCYGMFTFRTLTASLHQDVFVTFQGYAVIFTSFQTALPVQNNGTYTYFYGVGWK